MSGKLRNLRKRLAKVEQSLHAREKQKASANCTCAERTCAMAGSAAAFEAQMNQVCPAHGFRNLGQIMVSRFVVPDHYPESEKEEIRHQDAELDQLIQKYTSALSNWKRQRSTVPKIGLEEKHGSEEP